MKAIRFNAAVNTVVTVNKHENATVDNPKNTASLNSKVWTTVRNFVTAAAMAVGAVSCSPGMADMDVIETVEQSNAMTDQVVYVKTAEGTQTVSAGELDYDNNGKSDLTYAVSQSRDLEYHSAMADVKVSLSCENPALDIRVYRVEIANVKNHGILHFPANGLNARWSDLSSKGNLVMYDGAEMAMTGDEATEFEAFAIPQGTTGVDVDVYCTIYDRLSGTELWSSVTEGAPLDIKVSDIEWLQDHAYALTVDLSEPSVLDSIHMAVSVDDFADAN